MVLPLDGVWIAIAAVCALLVFAIGRLLVHWSRRFWSAVHPVTCPHLGCDINCRVMCDTVARRYIRVQRCPLLVASAPTECDQSCLEELNRSMAASRR